MDGPARARENLVNRGGVSFQADTITLLTFTPPVVATLRRGTVLVVKATVDGGQEAALTIPLAGFSTALDRTAALSK